MRPYLFQSPLANRLTTFFEMRRALGRCEKSDSRLFRYIDQFLIERLRPGEAITEKVAEQWMKHLEPLSVGTRINRTCVFRQFCRYLSHFDGRTSLLHRSFLPRRTRPAPYIYSLQQVRLILAAARQIGPPSSLRPEVIATLLGLLYATGLRIGEALKLTLGDVDLERRVLRIRQTKFKKSRDVPLSLSTAKALESYLHKRRTAGFSTVPTAPVFVNPKERVVSKTAVHTQFMEIMRGLGLRDPAGEKGPRLHDFRHSFAVQRLAAWYREKADLSAKLPLLTIYMGHSTVICTQVYLQATAELLEQAGKRFHAHCAIPLLRKDGRHAR